MEYAFTTICENAYFKLNGSFKQEYYLYNVRLGRHVDSSQDFDPSFQTGDRLDMTVVLVTIAFRGSCESPQRPKQQSDLPQLHKDSSRPMIHSPLYSKLADYRTSESVRTLLRDRTSLGLAVLLIFPNLRSDEPDHCSEPGSMRLTDRAAFLSIHQSEGPIMGFQEGFPDADALIPYGRPRMCHGSSQRI